MLEQADSVPAGSVLRADVVIAGAGAAGITLARTLAASGVEVLLLESGQVDYERETQDLYAGTVSGSPYDLEASRLRFFGGTTNHWGGWVRPLEPADFDGREWIPDTGWPIDRAVLDPYYPRAFEITSQIDDRGFDWTEWTQGPDPMLHPLIETSNLTGAIYRIAPVRFNDAYRPDLEAAETVQGYLGANVVGIRMGSEGEVAGFQVATLAGNTFEAVGTDYVLALGGIENARVLLNSDRGDGVAIGDHSGLLGRYFMDHIEANVATAVLSEPLPEGYAGGNFGLFRAAITLTESAQRAGKLPGVAFVLEEGPRWADPSWIPPGTEDLPAESVSEVLAAITDSEPSTWVVHMRAEPQPNPESRITLNEDTDALGVPTVDIHRVLTEGDHQRIRRAVELLAREFGAAGIGWLRIDAPGLGVDDTALYYGFHHMGTTRMSDDPDRGVVDSEGRVHGMANLWVAGSSVFPSTGFANPTLTIVALALRMADHLGAAPR